MTRHDDKVPKSRENDVGDKTAGAETKLDRRDFFKQGAAAGIGAVALAGGATSLQAHEADVSSSDDEWDYEVDVLVAGAGCCGLMAALRAKEQGAGSVMIIDQNFDIGGRMLHSGAFTSLGGGDAIQIRDMEGRADPEGFITVEPQHEPEELDDSVDLLFTDITDWSIVDAAGHTPYRYNEREQNRAWAENCPPTREFLMDNYVRFSRVAGTHGGGGLSRARAPFAFLMLGDVTDFRAGTITEEDAGVADDERTSPLAPVKMADASSVVGPGSVRNGVALARPLEFSAREKGIQFMLHRHLDELIREEPFAGRVIGVKAHYSPRINPETGERLESYHRLGNIDERRETIRIKARKAVILGTGGHAGNPQFRSMFYPALREPAFNTSGYALQGPNGQNASGIIAGMRVGANLAGMQQNLSYPTTFHISTRIATRDAYTDMFPGHPTFVFRGSVGLNIGNSGFEHLIAVNQVGKRFYNEIRLPMRVGSSRYPGGPDAGVPNEGLDHIPLDWRNCRPEWVRQMYDYSAGIDAALAMNEGSVAPHYYSGPLWAIFDQAAIDRMGWQVRYPYVADNGYFFSADTIEELARLIHEGHPYQRVPLTYLSETVETWNGYVEDGTDPDFERGEDAPMHDITEPPFYAASIMVIWHDSYGGLRINGQGQVIDMEGQPIRGLYAGGEVAGGINKHGLGRGFTQGFIAGTNAAREPH
ncbi:FAD-binding protein [Pelagibacterium halotolerans]|uniref:FAD-dependent oxidoreductase n=1 Tax=Pelagibacterium halotolerans TaxID=531813 RepID=UPI00384DFCF8